MLSDVPETSHCLHNSIVKGLGQSLQLYILAVHVVELVLHPGSHMHFHVRELSALFRVSVSQGSPHLKCLVPSHTLVPLALLPVAQVTPWVRAGRYRKLACF